MLNRNSKHERRNAPITACRVAAFVLIAASATAPALATGLPASEPRQVDDTPSVQTAVVDRIDIKSSWSGWGDEHSRIIITRSGSGYQLAGLLRGMDQPRTFEGTVAPDKVARLLAALRAPLQPTFRFADLGAAAGKAADGIRAEVRDVMSRQSYTPSQRALLERVLADRQRMGSTMSHGSPVNHTDDYPVISVVVHVAGHGAITAKSASQQPFMLPWTIEGRGKTWSPAVARAVRALMPPGSTNRPRLTFHAKDMDIDDLASLLLSGLDAALSRLEVREKSGSALAKLRAAFDVSMADIASHLADLSSTYPDEDLVATIRSHNAPSNLHMWFRAPLAGGEALHLDAEIARARHLFARVLATPAMMAVIASRPDVTFVINNWYGYSLHDAWTSLSDGDERADFQRYMAMKKHVKLDSATLAAAIFAREIRTLANRQWVLLPDGRLVLWRADARDPAKAGQGCPKPTGDWPSTRYDCIGKIF